MRRLLLSLFGLALMAGCSLVTETGSWTTRSAAADLVPDSSVAIGLMDGRAMYVGGLFFASKGPRPLTTVRIYDPASNQWPPAADLPVPLADPQATLLADGRVLITGGRGIGLEPVGTAFLYDPRTDSWSAAGNLPGPRWQHIAVQLANGKVLVAGGLGPGSLHSELFDPLAGTWSRAADLPRPSLGAVAAPLSTGEVLLMGGYSGGPANTGGGPIDPNTAQQLPNPGALLYDPIKNVWSQIPDPGFPLASPFVANLSDGRLFVLASSSRFGGSGRPAIFDPHGLRWTLAASIPSSTSPGSGGSIAISALRDGRVAVLQQGIGTAEVLVYVPAGNYWGFGPKVQVGQVPARPMRLADGRLMLTTGSISYDHTSAVDIYDATLALGANGGPLDSIGLSWVLTGLVGFGLVLVVGQFLWARQPIR